MRATAGLVLGLVVFVFTITLELRDIVARQAP